MDINQSVTLETVPGTIQLQSYGSGNCCRVVFRLTGEQLHMLTAVQDGDSVLIGMLGEHELKAFLKGMHDLYLSVYSKSEP